MRRRRKCLNCSYRFTSYERVESTPLMVIKRDGRREIFSRQKLSQGICRALQKRPISVEQIEDLLEEIEQTIITIAEDSHEIETSVVGEMILERLHHLDKVAYIRFASVYKQFTNLQEFITEVKKIHNDDEYTQ